MTAIAMALSLVSVFFETVCEGITAKKFNFTFYCAEREKEDWVIRGRVERKE